MSEQEKLNKIENLLEMADGVLTRETELDTLSNWDSMTALSFILLLEEEYNVFLSTDKILECKTVGDLLGFMETNG